ncbi:hypothetical protein CP10743SC13_0595 [Chlamydia psittaci 10_743_SC13]|nr:hypothetical protein CP10743SC13_0595 [Chlamydia psittaci 10_743_SC13]
MVKARIRLNEVLSSGLSIRRMPSLSSVASSIIIFVSIQSS